MTRSRSSRSAVVVLVVVLAMFGVACMRHAGRNVVEVNVITAEADASGATVSKSVVLRRDGTAERQTRIKKRVDEVNSDISQTGKFSTDKFERLAKVIEENGFFDMAASDGSDSEPSMTMRVTTDSESKTIQVSPGDPKVKNIVDAVNKIVDGIAVWKR